MTYHTLDDDGRDGRERERETERYGDVRALRCDAMRVAAVTGSCWRWCWCWCCWGRVFMSWREIREGSKWMAERRRRELTSRADGDPRMDSRLRRGNTVRVPSPGSILALALSKSKYTASTPPPSVVAQGTCPQPQRGQGPIPLWRPCPSRLVPVPPQGPPAG